MGFAEGLRCIGCKGLCTLFWRGTALLSFFLNLSGTLRCRSLVLEPQWRTTVLEMCSVFGRGQKPRAWMHSWREWVGMERRW